MSEYIARPSLMAKLTSSETQSAMREMDGSQAYSFFLAMVNSESAADVVEVKHGEWDARLMTDIGTYWVYWCSECNNFSYFKYDYCPNCGCKMEGE